MASLSTLSRTDARDLNAVLKLRSNVLKVSAKLIYVIVLSSNSSSVAQSSSIFILNSYCSPRTSSLSRRETNYRFSELGSNWRMHPVLLIIFLGHGFTGYRLPFNIKTDVFV